MPATPEFVRWTLPFACTLRDDTDITSPEQTERQLRSLRTYSECVAEGRELEGICLSESDAQLGFPSQEVLSAYGGQTFVHEQCDACPANILRDQQRPALAGCFGTLLLGEAQAALLESAIEQSGTATEIAELFLPTLPRWRGLWTQSLLDTSRLEVLHRVLSALAEPVTPDLQQCNIAVALARKHNLPFAVQLYPAGEADRDWWRVQAHCPRCKAPMGQRERRCAACGLHAHSEPARQRKARGMRPYVPLVRFLGEHGAREFLSRYAAEQRRAAVNPVECRDDAS